MLKTSNGEAVNVVNFLGRGGQGEVYLCLWRKKKYALKVFLDRKSTLEQSADVKKLVGKEVPHPAFVFPLVMLAGDKCNNSPGYVMDLVDTNRFVTVRDVASGKVATSLTAIVTACCNFARAFQKLEMDGLCYKDVNLDNLLWCPITGEIEIIDPDNISFSGSDSVVAGTFGTMAPEIIRLECGPSALTDLYSLSVVIFYMLTMGGHPLEGKRESTLTLYGVEAQAWLHGVKPLYIWSSHDSSNRPCPTDHARLIYFWERLPVAVKRIFHRSFTTGLHEPNQRVVTGDWIKLLSGLRDQTVRCAKCKTESFIDVENANARAICDKCQQSHQQQHKLYTGESENQVVLLSQGSRIFTHHFNASAIREDVVVGEINRHPHSNRALAFQNRSSNSLRVTFPSGKSATLPPTKSVRIQPGLKVSSSQNHEFV